MKLEQTHLGKIKYILGSVGNPDELNRHPWVDSLVVQKAVGAHPELGDKKPGYRLLFALYDTFYQMMPKTPPVRGKRSYTKWGQFGILAAKYFTPLIAGSVPPDSLYEAWLGIDESIQSLISTQAGEYNNSQAGNIKFKDGSDGVPPTSTLSTWHIRGLETLTANFLNRERYLNGKGMGPSVVMDPELLRVGRGKSKRTTLFLRLILIATFLVLFTIMGFAGSKLWQVYQAGRSLLFDIQEASTFLSGSPDLDEFETYAPLVPSIRQHMIAFAGEVEPLVKYCSVLGWVPEYGGDLAACADLLALGVNLSIAVEQVYQGGEPMILALQDEGRSPTPTELLEMLVDGQPHFHSAGGSLSLVKAARESFDLQEFSNFSQEMITQIDEYLLLMEDGLAVAESLPVLLGSGDRGPQTYLLLLQNEDELRATGGFITAVGNITLAGGKITSFSVEHSPEVDNFELPYNRLPWQMVDYMDGGLWLMRDANWSPDFPVVAEFAEQLYAYSRLPAVDGVFTIDQRSLQLLLKAIGPVTVEGEVVSDENVINYMRRSRLRLGSELGGSHRKDFIPVLIKVILNKIQNDPNIDWVKLMDRFSQALDEKHILLQVDDLTMNAVIAGRGWNGELQQGEGDFLMVVDSNLGFNKVNAVIDLRIVYNVDISSLASPTASLLVTHKNNSTKEIPCEPRYEIENDAYEALIDQCYWNYLRVYTQKDTTLIDAVPHAIPGWMMLLGEDVPARVDVLGMFDGGDGFGTMMVVPTNSSLETEFQFGLSPTTLAIEEGGNTARYSLRVQKQPGTDDVPIELKVRLPEGAEILDGSAPGEWQGDFWITNFSLKEDIEFFLHFRTP
jgi:hypothetical protein